jgi:flavoprotein
MMKIHIKTYIVHVHHDKGEINIQVGAQNKKVARDMVMNFERCPRRAIKKVTLVERKPKRRSVDFSSAGLHKAEGRGRLHYPWR